MNRIYTIIAIILLATAPFNAFAQKKKPVSSKPSAPKEDFSEWIENPVCNVLIFDSLVTDRDNVANNLKIPAHVGRLFKEPGTGKLVYENEFADQRLFAAKDSTGYHNIFRQTLLGTQWSKPEPIVVNGNFKDIINPFPMPDGQTLYFAGIENEAPASEGDEEAKPAPKPKTYSLYTTTLDTETNTYRTPQRLPYPFFSKADDLWYIEDDVDSLAWFVSARNQPEGKVCIYTMRIHEPWVYYDSEETAPSKLKKLALIERIADTWPSTKERNNVYAEATSLLDSYHLSSLNSQQSTLFRVNDQKIYRDINDFSSEDARKLYGELKEQENKVTSIQRQLDEYRRLYHNAAYENRTRLADVIRESEQQLVDSKNAVRTLTIALRKQETHNEEYNDN